MLGLGQQRQKEVVEACEELERAVVFSKAGDGDSVFQRSCLVDVLQGIGKEVERCGDGGTVVELVSGWGGCFFKTMHVLCFTPRYVYILVDECLCYWI